MQPEFLLALTGRLYDGFKLWPHATVLLDEKWVLKVGEGLSVPSQARVLPVASDETILPGLVDLHVHARPRYAPWFPGAGVTAVRDAGGSLTGLQEARAWAAVRQGPRVFGAGAILDGESSFFTHFGPGAVTGIGDLNAGAWFIRTPQDAETAVERLAEAGAWTIKLYEQLPPDAYAAAVVRARELGLNVMTDLGMRLTRGLAGAQVDALQALKLGVCTIEHASGFALAYQRMGFDPASQFPDDAVLDGFAQNIVDAGAMLVPTLSVFAGGSREERADLSRLPASNHADEMGGEYGLKTMWDAVHRTAVGKREPAAWDLRLAAELARRVVDRGGQVGAGTDTPAGVDNLPGGGLHAELEYLVTLAGLTPEQALHAATGAASALLDGGCGVLRAGADADVLVVRGDPTRDILATRQLRQVIFGGQLWA
ncbi:Amidohydrolase-related domain-containing protein [Deinococcus saxicola]|uniref:amidohydrolase family protein n=1 Tax=Deinococcus saxicola TaxID=249406 RepID=UPI0039EF5D09